jgi:diguanylate cyclase (GGDEF)-like protein
VSVIRKILAINIGIVIAFGGIAFFIARSIARPIQGLSNVARRIAQGETDVVIQTSRGQDEIGVLSRALHQMVARLRRNQVELERKQDEIERANRELQQANEELRRGNEVLEQLSFTDGLTRLHNHRYFQDRLRMEGRRCERSQDPLTLLLLDIDDFKSLNDRYGHAVGDEVLRRVAQVINNTVRETDLPARYGGEEFAVLAPSTDREGGMALAEKLRLAVSMARIRGTGVEDAKALSVTISVGVAVYAGDSQTLFNAADRSLYAAKSAGKDCVVCADV